MLRYTSSDTMLVDYMSQEYYGMLDLHVSENQCAFLRHADGKSDLFDPGEYVISQEKSSSFTGSLFAKADRVDLFWLNLSDHIDMRLNHDIHVMEQLVKYLLPELKTYYPVAVRVATDISVRIDDRSQFLAFLCSSEQNSRYPVRDTESLRQLLERKLYYKMEEAVNEVKQRLNRSIYEMNQITDEIEVAILDSLCDLLAFFGLELVAVHVSRIILGSSSLVNFRKKENETMDWYNQVQMERFAKKQTRSRRQSGKGREKSNAAAARIPAEMAFCS